MRRFSLGEAISYGWKTVKAELGLFLGLAAVFLVISGGLNGAAGHGWGISGPISWALTMLMMMGVIRITLKFVDGGKGQFSDLWANFDLALDFLGASLLYALIIVAGLVLLIVPCIIWAIRFGFYGYFIIERKSSALEALKQSSALTKGARGQLFVFGLALLGINLLGAICLGIGMLVSLPVTWLAQALVYRRLQATAVPAAPIEPAAPSPPLES
ncbi:MAG: DUF975 family protein [candidate division WOR-3 bacterium]